MNPPNKKYTDAEERQIVQEYLNGTQIKDLLVRYGFRTGKSITDKVRKYGGTVRSQRETKMTGKFYETLDMSIIDNPFKAYYLGLLITDGYIVGNSIGLSMTDEDVISFVSENLQKAYKTYRHVEPNKKPTHRVIFNNPNMITQLARFGVVSRKSKTLSGFEWHKKELPFFPYFIRGVIDGNGWVRKDGREFYICTASNEFACWLKSEMEARLYMTELNLPTALNPNGTMMYYIRTSLQHNIFLLKHIVYRVPYGMSRKYSHLHPNNDEPSETIMEGSQQAS